MGGEHQSHETKSTGRRPDRPSPRSAAPTASAMSPILAMHDAIGNRAMLRFVQARLRVGAVGDPYEQEADRVAAHVTRSTSEPMLQRKCSCGGAGPCPTCEAEQQELLQRKARTRTFSRLDPLVQRTPDEPASAGTETTRTPLIAEDGAESLEPGQMRKSDFLSQLRSSVCRAAEEMLEGTVWSSLGCPWIDHWFGYYAGRSGSQVERAIHLYAPGSASATSASQYIPIVTERVRQAIAVWRNTGQIPAGVPTGMSSGGPTSLLGGLVSGLGRLLFKDRDGGAHQPDSPHAVLSRLGPGRPLDGDVGGRIGSALGQDFSHVRIHTDTTAAQLNDSLNARAFTLGNHIAFASGEYQPGSLTGTALIAHELAHVVQQTGAVPAAGPLSREEGGDHDLEHDADRSAVGAVLSLWSRAKTGLSSLAHNALPRFKSGLKLQRCRRTVRRCPPGKHWDVVGQPAGLGSFGCVCNWRCVPGAEPRAELPSSGPVLRCPPDVVCEPPPVPVDVPDDYQFESRGTVTGYGAHFTPLGSAATCGCLPLDIDGKEVTGAPMREVGFDPTAFFPRAWAEAAGGGGAQTGTGPPVMNRPRVVIVGEPPAGLGGRPPSPVLPETGGVTLLPAPASRVGGGPVTLYEPSGPLGRPIQVSGGQVLPETPPSGPVLLYDPFNRPMSVSGGRASPTDWYTTPGGGSLLVNLAGEPLAGGGRLPTQPLLGPSGRPIASTPTGTVFIDLQAGRPDFLQSLVAQTPGSRGIGYETGDWLLGYQGIHPTDIRDLTVSRQLVQQSPMWPDTPAWRTSIEELPRLQSWQIDPSTYLFPQQGPVIIRTTPFFGPVGGTTAEGQTRLVPLSIQDVTGIVPTTHPEIHGMGNQVFLRRPFGFGVTEATRPATAATPETTAALGQELARILSATPGSFVELRLRAASELDVQSQLPIIQSQFPGATVVIVPQTAINRFLNENVLPSDPVQAQILRDAEADLRGSYGPLGQGLPRRIVRIYYPSAGTTP